MTRSIFHALALCGTFAFTASAQADVLYPGPFAGSSVVYTDVIEASADPINDPEPLYGAPEIETGNLLDFDPANFAFSASSPLPDTTDGALTFNVDASGNDFLDSLVITESGDYAFSGTPVVDASVAAIVLVQVFDENENLLVADSATFSDTYNLLEAPTKSGFWDLSLSIDLTDFDVSNVKVILNNVLQAASDNNSAAFIRKKDFEVDVPSVTPIPEPASVALLAAGVILMAGRTRRHQA